MRSVRLGPSIAKASNISGLAAPEPTPATASSGVSLVSNEPSSPAVRLRDGAQSENVDKTLPPVPAPSTPDATDVAVGTVASVVVAPTQRTESHEMNSTPTQTEMITGMQSNDSDNIDTTIQQPASQTTLQSAQPRAEATLANNPVREDETAPPTENANSPVQPSPPNPSLQTTDRVEPMPKTAPSTPTNPSPHADEITAAAQTAKQPMPRHGDSAAPRIDEIAPAHPNTRMMKPISSVPTHRNSAPLPDEVGSHNVDDAESDHSSIWADGISPDIPRQAKSSPVYDATAPSFSTDRTSSDYGQPRKVFPNLAALAASAIRQRKPKVQVRYYAQVDMQSIAYRRHRLVKKRYDFHLRLEESDLIVTRRPRRRAAAAAMAAAAATGDTSNAPTISTIDAAKRTVMNVRTERVLVDHNKCEIIMYRKDRERPLRLVLKSEELCAQWDRALKKAKTCHIRQFYELGPTLGRGAYGEVVQATDLNSRETRAVKIVKRGTTPKSIEHLSRELKVMQSVSHPGIVQTYQIFEGKTIYMVMEYVPGGDLFDFVASRDVLTEAQGAATMRSIVGAVAYLHSANIVHRDLKPENILCRKKEWPLETKLTDFGFSTLLNPDDSSVMRTPVGTAYFMAPEIITNQGHGPPVDVWACGVILYTILTGRLPFPGRNRAEYFRSVTQKKALFPPSLWKGISKDALNLVKGMLNKDPKIRLTALGVLQHKWITDPKSKEADTGIKRNRQNLHSRRRRLYKARSAIIAVAMAQKFRATALVDLIEKMPGGVEKLKENTTRFVHKTTDGILDTGDKLGEGTRKVAENVGEGTRKFKENVGEGTRKFGEGTKKFAEKAGEGTKKFAGKAGEGVKKAGQGMEQGAKKMGEGVKKTGEGIKKSAGKAGAGVKKTREELKDGAKKTAEKTKEGVKKAGEGIKKGAEKVKMDKIKLDKLKIPLDNLKPKFGGSTTDSQTSAPRKGMFRKKARFAPTEVTDDAISSAPSNRSQPVVTLDDDGKEIEVEERDENDARRNDEETGPSEIDELEEVDLEDTRPRAVETEETKRGAAKTRERRKVKFNFAKDREKSKVTDVEEKGELEEAEKPDSTLYTRITSSPEQPTEPPKEKVVPEEPQAVDTAPSPKPRFSNDSDAVPNAGKDVDEKPEPRENEIVKEEERTPGEHGDGKDAVSKQVSHVSNVSDQQTESEKVAKQDSHLWNISEERANVEGRHRPATKEKVDDAIEKHSSQISNESASVSASRLLMRPPKLPLGALGLGWGTTNQTEAAALSGSSEEDDDAAGGIKLRRTAALLLATSDVSNPRSAEGQKRNGRDAPAIASV